MIKLGIFIIALLSCSVAEACKCAKPTPEKAIFESDKIFVGVVKEIDIDSKKNADLFTFDVLESIKADKETEFKVYTPKSSCSSIFAEKNEKVLIVAKYENGELVSSCSSFNLTIMNNPRVNKSLFSKYNVRDIDLYRHLGSLSEEQLSKLVSSDLKIEIDETLNTYIDDTVSINFDWQYTELKIKAGSSAGVYRGMKFCSAEDKNDYIEVLDVGENYSLAVHSSFSGEPVPMPGQKFNRCIIGGF